MTKRALAKNWFLPAAFAVPGAFTLAMAALLSDRIVEDRPIHLSTAAFHVIAAAVATLAGILLMVNGITLLKRAVERHTTGHGVR
jgi:hypothetical protein